jgi:peptidyl-prolyl cis-trans isomerase C
VSVSRPFATFGAALALALASSGPARADDFGVAARVNGAAIGLERLERYFEENLQEKGRLVAGIRSPAAFKTMKREALDELVDRELLWQEAERRKRVTPQKEVDAAMARFRAQVPDPARRRLQLERSGFTEQTYTEYVKHELSIRRLVDLDLAPKVKVTAAEVHASYEADLDRYTQPAEVRARHVLVKVATEASPEQKAEARRRIDAVLAEAKAGADFGALARRSSDDETASAGGELGWFPRGRMVPAFEAVAFSLKPGQLSGVVETPFGYHVIQVEESHPEVREPESKVAGAIRARLGEEKVMKAVRALVAELRATARIEILIPLEAKT